MVIVFDITEQYIVIATRLKIYFIYIGIRWIPQYVSTTVFIISSFHLKVLFVICFRKDNVNTLVI